MVESCGEVLERTTQRMHHQPGGFIIGVERAVAVGESGAAKALGGGSDQLPGRVQLGGECWRFRHKLSIKNNYLL